MFELCCCNECLAEVPEVWRRRRSGCISSPCRRLSVMFRVSEKVICDVKHEIFGRPAGKVTYDDVIG